MPGATSSAALVTTSFLLLLVRHLLLLAWHLLLLANQKTEAQSPVTHGAHLFVASLKMRLTEIALRLGFPTGSTRAPQKKKKQEETQIKPKTKEEM